MVTAARKPRRTNVSVQSLEATITRLMREGLCRPVPWSEVDPTDPHAGGFRRVYRLAHKPHCYDPVAYEVTSRTSSKAAKAVQRITLWGTAPCRKCERCLQMRAYGWQQRAMVEFERSPRTYFGTFTMSPDEHYMLDSRATVRLLKGGTRWSDLTDQDIFYERCREFGNEIGGYFKRIRAGRGGHSPTRFRYLLIAEAHDGPKTAPELRGRPHFHILLHELTIGSLVEGDPVEVKMSGVQNGELEARYHKTKRGEWKRYVFVADDAFLRHQWTLGFTKFQFAENSLMATYITKYLSKSLLYKVRASNRYGLNREIDGMKRNDREVEENVVPQHLGNLDPSPRL